MGIPKIMNGPPKAQAPKNSVAMKPYSGSSGYETTSVSSAHRVLNGGGPKSGS